MTTNSPELALEWRIDRAPIDYEDAVAAMEERASAIRAGTAGELIWLLHHPPLYTAGTSARDEDLLTPDRFPVHRTGRGGQFTYHGPGQRVAYVLLDLDRRGRDIRAHVCHLEDWVIRTLAQFGIRGERRSGRVGIWVVRPDGGEDKIAAIGVRVRRWVTLHGLALNVAPDLDHFAGIIPCGIREHGVTSMAALGATANLDQVDQILRHTFAEAFGPEPTTPGLCPLTPRDGG